MKEEFNSVDNPVSYRRVVKAASVLGGVQVLTILSGVVRTKVAAMLLGPSGIGIMGLFSSSLEMFKTGSGLGLPFSSIREISRANASDPLSVKYVISVLRRWLMTTALAGSLVMIIFSSYLSRKTFGTTDYTFSFVLLSLTVFFATISAGGSAILQGLGRLKQLAKVGVWSSLLSAVVAVPLFYFLRKDGIVPSIIISAFLLWVITWFYTRDVESGKISFRVAIAEGSNMVKMGIALMISGLVAMLVAYLLRIYIGAYGGLEEVGFLQAAMVITESYLGIIYTSNNSDFYPRLSAVSDDNQKMCGLINEQAEIGLLILGPVVVIFISFLPFLIRLLYEGSFLVIQSFLVWALFASLMKMTSVTAALVLISKNCSKLYIIISFIFQALFLLISCIGYRLGGIEGLGLAYLIYTVINLTVILILCGSMFQLFFRSVFWKIFAVTTFLTTIVIIVKNVVPELTGYLLCSVCILISVLYSFHELDCRVGVKSVIKNWLKVK